MGLLRSIAMLVLGTLSGLGLVAAIAPNKEAYATTQTCAANCNQCFACRMNEVSAAAKASPPQPPKASPPQPPKASPPQQPPKASPVVPVVRPANVTRPPYVDNVAYHITTDRSLNWGRMQFDNNNGYCGEMSIQTLMLPFGVWVPQVMARELGNNGDQSYELILQDRGARSNMLRALDLMLIRYETFRGSNYNEFVSWGKGLLKRGIGFIFVTFNSEGDLTEYDHITPMVGLSRDERHWFTYTGYNQRAVKVAVNSYSCTVNSKRRAAVGGCVPTNTKWGIAITGPTYANNVMPVELLNLSDNSEGVFNMFRGMRMNCTVRCYNLVPGTKYAVHMAVGPANVAKFRTIPPIRTFTATGPEFRFQAGFNTGNVTYFLCVPTT